MDKEKLIKGSGMLQVLLVVAIGVFLLESFEEINNKILDHVVITDVNSIYSNTCDPSYVGRFDLSRTRSGDYKRCGDEVIRKIMIQMVLTLL